MPGIEEVGAEDRGVPGHVARGHVEVPGGGGHLSEGEGRASQESRKFRPAVFDSAGEVAVRLEVVTEHRLGAHSLPVQHTEQWCASCIVHRAACAVVCIVHRAACSGVLRAVVCSVQYTCIEYHCLPGEGAPPGCPLAGVSGPEGEVQQCH